MRRVLVIGCGGSGKSTFSRDLAHRTGLPLVHLDRLYWKPGWVESTNDAWVEIIDQVAAEPAWIMDGNYGGTLDRRLAACDTVILMDTPRHVCLWRVLKRRFTPSGRNRPDRPEGCPPRVDADFLRWIWTYRKERLPGIRERLRGLKGTKRVEVISSRAQAERLLASA